MEVTNVFPGAITVSSLVTRVITELEAKGYKPQQTVPAMATCRDDTTGEVRSAFDRHGFHTAFSMQTLSALPVTGNTALVAWYHHLMDNNSPGVLLYTPHLGIHSDGKLGYLTRYGISDLAKSCGANHGLLSLWAKGDYGPYPNDFELSEISAWLKDYIPEIINDPEPIRKIAQVEHDLGYASLRERLLKLQAAEHHYHPILFISGLYIETDRNVDWSTKRNTEDWILIHHFEWLENKPAH